MATPTKNEIIAKATELFHYDRAKHGDPSFSITPTETELKENGYFAQAVSELMRDNSMHLAEQWGNYDRETKKLGEKSESNGHKQQVKTEIPFDILEAKDTGWFTCGTSQSGKTTLNKHLAERLIDNGIAVYVLDVSRAWMEQSPIRHVVTVPHNGNEISIQPMRSTVLDLSELSFAERFRFVNAFTAMIYRWCKSFGYKSAPFTFVIYEEAQTYLPNGCMRSARKYNALIDLVTVGANYNLRFGLITQFPAMVDKAPVKISQQRYFGWTTEKNDLDYIRKFIGKRRIPEIKALRKGEFLYQCRNEIAKFQCERYGSAKVGGFNYQYDFPIPIVS